MIITLKILSFQTNTSRANSAEPDQTAPVSSGSLVFASPYAYLDILHHGRTSVRIYECLQHIYWVSEHSQQCGYMLSEDSDWPGHPSINTDQRSPCALNG